jgi:hypothetical protein
MAPKRTRKLVQETVVEEPTQDLDVPSEAMREEEQNNSKARGLNLRENLSRKGLLSKGANPREMLVGNLKEYASIVMKWGITPRIAPNPNRGMGSLRGFPQLHNTRKYPKNGASVGGAQGTHRGTLCGWDLCFFPSKFVNSF